MSIKGARPRNGLIAPHLLVRDAEAAIEFYRSVLGAVELYRSPMPPGVGLHAQLRIGDSTVLISSENLMHQLTCACGRLRHSAAARRSWSST